MQEATGIHQMFTIRLLEAIGGTMSAEESATVLNGG